MLDEPPHRCRTLPMPALSLILFLSRPPCASEQGFVCVCVCVGVCGVSACVRVRVRANLLALLACSLSLGCVTHAGIVSDLS